MRRAANFLIPITLFTMYYVFWAGVMSLLLIKVPVVRDFFPVGGLGDLARNPADELEIIYSDVEQTILAPHGPFRLMFASIGAAILIVPVSWVYFITSRTKEVDQSFVQTIIVMPIVVTGIALLFSIACRWLLHWRESSPQSAFDLRWISHHLQCTFSFQLALVWARA